MSFLEISRISTAALTVLLVTGCATDHGKSVSENTAGAFVSYTCENGKSFSARFSPETATVRIRTMDGSAELSKGARGLYRDEAGNWNLRLGAEKSTELIHKGKITHTDCTATT